MSLHINVSSCALMSRCPCVLMPICNVYVLHIMPPGAPPSTAVDNGGDRSCQFLGLRPVYTNSLITLTYLGAAISGRSHARVPLHPGMRPCALTFSCPCSLVHSHPYLLAPSCQGIKPCILMPLCLCQSTSPHALMLLHPCAKQATWWYFYCLKFNFKSTK